MNKRLISRLMHERVHGLRSSLGYFFRGDFEHILQGVVLEYVPRGLYVWSFRFPVFDFFGPNLSFSNRIHERPFVGNGEMSEQEIVDFVTSSAEIRQAFDAKMPMSLMEFFDQHLANFDPRRNPGFLLIKAAALVLSDQDSRAQDLLNEPPPNLRQKDLSHWNELRESLQKSHESALASLAGVRQSNLRALGVA